MSDHYDPRDMLDAAHIPEGIDPLSSDPEDRARLEKLPRVPPPTWLSRLRERPPQPSKPPSPTPPPGPLCASCTRLLPRSGACRALAVLESAWAPFAAMPGGEAATAFQARADAEATAAHHHRHGEPLCGAHRPRVEVAR